jgi:hypothetical protein
MLFILLARNEYFARLGPKYDLRVSTPHLIAPLQLWD